MTCPDRGGPRLQAIESLATSTGREVLAPFVSTPAERSSQHRYFYYLRCERESPMGRDWVPSKSREGKDPTFLTPEDVRSLRTLVDGG